MPTEEEYTKRIKTLEKCLEIVTNLLGLQVALTESSVDKMNIYNTINNARVILKQK